MGFSFVFLTYVNHLFDKVVLPVMPVMNILSAISFDKIFNMVHWLMSDEFWEILEGAFVLFAKLHSRYEKGMNKLQSKQLARGDIPAERHTTLNGMLGVNLQEMTTCENTWNDTVIALETTIMDMARGNIDESLFAMSQFLLGMLESLVMCIGGQ